MVLESPEACNSTIFGDHVIIGLPDGKAYRGSMRHSGRCDEGHEREWFNEVERIIIIIIIFLKGASTQ